jgi:laccase
MPRRVDRAFFFTVGLGTNPCARADQTCQGPKGIQFTASINNFLGVYTADLPFEPLEPFSYTGTRRPTTATCPTGPKVVALQYNTSVEVVMQDTSILGAESHPLHLHGFDFFVVGQGVRKL